MNKKSLSIFTAFFIIFPLIAFNVNAVEKYVTDSLPIYLKRGPGNEYAITGTLNSGDKVTVLSTSDSGKYTQIKTDTGKIAWVNTSDLTNTPSLKEQVSKLSDDLTSAQQKLSTIEQEKQTQINDYSQQLSAANQKITELEQSKNQLQQQTDQQQSQITSLSNTMDESRQALIMKWFVRGGLVAGIGLILGLVLPMIIPRRRKKDRWMS